MRDSLSIIRKSNKKNNISNTGKGGGALPCAQLLVHNRRKKNDINKTGGEGGPDVRAIAGL